MPTHLPHTLAPAAVVRPGVETALKLLCWSWVVYYDQESDGAACSAEPAANGPAGPEEDTAGGGPDGEAVRQAYENAATGAADPPAVEVSPPRAGTVSGLGF